MIRFHPRVIYSVNFPSELKERKGRKKDANWFLSFDRQAQGGNSGGMPTVQVLRFGRRPGEQPSIVFESATNSILAQKQVSRETAVQLEQDDDWSVGEESAIQIKDPQRVKIAPFPIDRQRCILPTNGHFTALPPIRPPSNIQEHSPTDPVVEKHVDESRGVIQQYFVSLFATSSSIRVLKHWNHSCIKPTNPGLILHSIQLEPFTKPKYNILSSRPLPNIYDQNDVDHGSFRYKAHSSPFKDPPRVHGRLRIEQPLKRKLSQTLPSSFGPRRE